MDSVNNALHALGENIIKCWKELFVEEDQTILGQIWANLGKTEKNHRGSVHKNRGPVIHEIMLQVILKKKLFITVFAELIF